MKLLFEIGTEELPSGEIDGALKDLQHFIEKGCKQARLPIGEIRTYGTPRRLALTIDHVAAGGEDLEEIALGPAVKIAFDDEGKPTRAAQGFARGKGIDVSQLQRVETPKGEYIAATVHEPGRPASEILTEILTQAPAQIHWKRSMRWGWGETTFARPVKWIVALLDNDTLNVEFAGIKAGRSTRGHRFLAPESFALTSTDAWLPALHDAYVMADIQQRREKIREDLQAVAQQADYQPIIDEELIDEVVHLVEWPVAMLGTFNPELLEVPREVLITSMKTHQRYFSCEDKDGNLTNAFVFISNMVVDHPDIIVAGNQRVLAARLEDARFFWREDRKRTLESRLEDLKAIRYIEGLGSLHDRTERLVTLAKAYAANLFDDATANKAERAATLSRCDLATQMVFEFPELQGIMGRYYAREDGEDHEVATAIDEHYMPRGAADATPGNNVGVSVALAEKLDAITGCFALGLRPSGSADPYALRRAAIGVLRIAIEHQLRFDIQHVVDQAYDALPAGKIRPREQVVPEVVSFIRDRLRVLLGAYPTDIANAVIATLSDDIPSMPERARVLDKLRTNADFEPLAAGFKRVVNILQKAEEEDGEIGAQLKNGTLQANESLLQAEEERALFTALTTAQMQLREQLETRDFDSAAQTLIELKSPIDRFFDVVLVNDDNPQVRRNRLGLLQQLRSLFLSFADLSLVQVTQAAAS